MQNVVARDMLDGMPKRNTVMWFDPCICYFQYVQFMSLQYYNSFLQNDKNLMCKSLFPLTNK